MLTGNTSHHRFVRAIMQQTQVPPVPTPPAVPPIPAIAQGGGLPASVDPAALQAQLAQLEGEGAASDVQVAELTGQLRQARQEAQDAAEAARQTEAERRRKGRWARLRAAWRGE